MGHRNPDGVVAAGNGGSGKAVSLAAKHNSQLFNGFKNRIINADRVIAQCHGRCLESEIM